MNEHVLKRRTTRNVCSMSCRLTGQHMRPYHRQMIERLAIGIANEDTLGHAPGVLPIDLLQQFGDGRQCRPQRNKPLAIPRFGDAGVFQNIKAIDQERPELGIAREAGEHDGAVAVGKFQRNVMAGAIDCGIEKKARIVRRMLLIGDKLRCNPPRIGTGFPSAGKKSGGQALIMKGNGIERRSTTQLRAAETAIIESGNRLVICVEQGETRLDRIRAETLDLDDGFDNRPSLAENPHRTEVNGNIGRPGLIAGELIEQCDEAVKCRVDRHRVEIIRGERVGRQGGGLQIHFDHMMTKCDCFRQELEMRAIVQSETFRRFVSHISGQCGLALLAGAIDGSAASLARERLAAATDRMNRPFVMAEPFARADFNVTGLRRQTGREFGHSILG